MPQGNVTGQKPGIRDPLVLGEFGWQKPEGELPLIVSYHWLERAGIFHSRTDCHRKRAAGFPAPLQLSPNQIAWKLTEVLAWLEARPRRVPAGKKAPLELSEGASP